MIYLRFKPCHDSSTPPPDPPPTNTPQAAEAEEVAALVAAARSTPKGDRKLMSPELYKGYHPPMVR